MAGRKKTAERNKAIGKRGVGPIKVLRPDNFPEGTSLAEINAAMVENRYDIFIRNVDFLRKKHNLSQAELCQNQLEGMLSSPQLTGYKTRGRTIPLEVISLIASSFKLSMEEMCGQLLEDNAQIADTDESEMGRPVEEYEKYTGTYDLAYFDTSKPLGENFSPVADSLNYAVMTIYPTSNAVGIKTFHATAIFNCTLEERQKIAGLLEEVNLSKDGNRVYKCFEDAIRSLMSDPPDYSRMKCLYTGEIHLTERMSELTLGQVKGSDVVHLMAHNRPAASSEGKKYKGGLGTMMSVSRGAEHMPCVQAVLMMRKIHTEVAGEGRPSRKLTTSRFEYYSKEQIASLLRMAPPKIEIKEELDAVIAYTKSLYMQSENQQAIANLSDEDKRFCLENFVQKKLSDSLQRNILSYYKVALQMDSDVYQLMKIN